MPVALTDLSTWLTRGTVWLALTLYTAAEATRPPRFHLPLSLSLSRFRSLNTAGCIAFLAHVVCAFTFHHSWSHTAAYTDTAEQTARLTGWHWGGGLYINYAFALLWLSEVLWSWSSPNRYLHRSPWITRTIRAIFLFMIINGAIIFVQNPARWLGILLCTILIASWCPRRPAP